LEFTYPAVQYNVVPGNMCNVINIEGTKVNLQNKIFHCELVQPGMVQKRKELGPYVSKFHILSRQHREGDVDMLKIFDETLTVIPLKAGKPMQTYFGGGPFDPANSMVYCRSWDGETPDPSMPEIQSASCMTCAKSKFQDKTPPKCQKRIPVYFFDTKRNIVFRFDMYGKGLTAWNNLTKQYTGVIESALLNNVDISLENYVVTMAASNEGTYAALSMTLVKQEESIKNMFPIINYYQDFLDKELAPKSYAEITTAMPVGVAADNKSIEQLAAELGEELPNL